MTLNDELHAAVSTLEPPDLPAPRFERVQRRQRRRRQGTFASVVVVAVLAVGIGVARSGGGDSTQITTEPSEPSSSVGTTVPLPPGSDALGLTAQLPAGWSIQRGACPTTSTITVIDKVTELPTPAGCRDVDGPWTVVQRLPTDLDGIDTACTPVFVNNIPTCSATEIDPAKGADGISTDRRFYAGLDVLVSTRRDPSGAAGPEIHVHRPCRVPGRHRRDVSSPPAARHCTSVR